MDPDIAEATVVVIVGNGQDDLISHIGNLVCGICEKGLSCRVLDEFGREVYFISIL